MRKHKLLKDSIELLKIIEIELHDDIDSSKRYKLKQAIKELESSRDKITHKQILVIMGRVIALIPAIERIIKHLSE